MVKEIKGYLSEDKRISDWLKMHLSTYLKKGGLISHQEVEHIIDYLKSDRSPKRLSRLSVEQAKVQSEKWTVSLNKKFKNFSQIEADSSVEFFKTYDENMAWVRLVSKEAFSREGALMSHCVGSYYDRAAKKGGIFSLRDEKNLPHCTIEVGTNLNISQIKGKANQRVSDKYHDYVLDFINNSGFMCEIYHDLKNLNAYKIKRDNEVLIVKLSQLENGDEFLSDALFSDISQETNLPENLTFKDLSVGTPGKGPMKKFDIPEGWSVINLSLNNVKLKADSLSVSSLSASQSTIEVDSIEANSVNITGGSLYSQKVNSEKIRVVGSELDVDLITSSESTLINCIYNPNLKIKTDFLTIESSEALELNKNSNKFQKAFLNFEIEDFLELKGHFLPKLKFPDMNIQLLNILHTNISTFPKNVKADTLYVNELISDDPNASDAFSTKKYLKKQGRSHE